MFTGIYFKTFRAENLHLEPFAAFFSTIYMLKVCL